MVMPVLSGLTSVLAANAPEHDAANANRVKILFIDFISLVIKIVFVY
jgi:hypothetical protein